MLKNMSNVGEAGHMKTIEKLSCTDMRLNGVKIKNVKHHNKPQSQVSTLLVNLDRKEHIYMRQSKKSEMQIHTPFTFTQRNYKQRLEYNTQTLLNLIPDFRKGHIIK